PVRDGAQPRLALGSGAIAGHEAHDLEQHHGPHERGDETDQQPAAAHAEDRREQPAADARDDDADNDIHEDSVPVTAHDPPGQGARDTADDQEHDELHTYFLLRTRLGTEILEPGFYLRCQPGYHNRLRAS